MKKIIYLWIISIFVFCNVSVQAQTFTNSTPTAIPDNTPAGIYVDIPVSGISPLSKIDNVTINITHTWDSDLDIYLVDPLNNEHLLSSANGGSGDNYTNTIFRTTAGTSITLGVAPFTGTYIPQSPLPTGINPNGTWRLHVEDWAAGDVGTVQNWSITFVAPPCPTVGIHTSPTVGLTTMPCTDFTNLYPNDSAVAGGAIYPTLYFQFNTGANGTSNGVTIYEDGISIYADPVLDINTELTVYWPGPSASPSSNYTINVCNNGGAAPMTWVIYDGNGTTYASGTTPAGCTTYGPWSPAGIATWTISPAAAGLYYADWGGAAFYGDESGPGTYTLTYNWNNQGSGAFNCVGSASTTITVTNPWSATWNSPGTVCASGGSLNLNSYITGSPGGTWSGTGVSGNTFNPLGLSGPINVTYYVGNSAACNASATQAITVVTNPTATAVSNSPVCVGSTLTLTGGPGSMASYSWSGPNGFTSTSQNPTVSGSATTAMAGTYSLTVTNSSGCTNTTTTSVTVNTLPVPSASNNSPVCEGSTLTLSGLPNSMSNYSWSGPNSYTSTSQNPTVSGSATTAMSGTYTLTVTNTNGCSNTTTTAVTVNASPVATATNNGPVCEGTVLNLTGAPGGMISYSWSGPNGFTSSLQSPTVSSNTTTAMAGTYTLTVLNSNNCTNNTSTAVTVNTNPTPSITGSLTFCTGSSTTLNAGPGYSTYTWSPSGNTQTINVTSAGTYSVTVTNSSGCTGTASVSVTVSSSLTPSITGSITFCTGSSTILDAGAGYSTYTWLPSGNSQTLNVTSAGNYSVTVTDANGCSGTDNVTVTENTNPIPAITGTLTFCTGGSTILDAGSGYSTYVWSPSGNTQTTNVTSAGNYAVTVTDANGCSGTDNIDVTENSNPAPIISGALSFCTGGSTTLDAGSGYSTYVWSPSGNTQTINVTSAGAYSVTVTNTNGCTGSATVNVTVNSSLTPSITGALTYCSGNSTTLDAGSGYSTYIWSPSGSTQTINVTVAGTYSVTVSNTSGCTGTASVNVTENTSPTPSISGALSFCTGGSTTLDAGSGYSTYVWSPSGNTQTINVTSAGNYAVTVTDANGCSGTDNIDVTENSNPAPVISGALSFCTGGSTTLDAGSGYSTYVWSPSGNTQTINVTSAGTYSVTVTNTNGCTGSASVNVTVNSSLTPSITGALTYCSGNSTTLDAGSGYSTYIWSPSGSTQTINVTAAGTYSVTVSNTSGCTGTASVNVTENTSPTPSISGALSFCTGGSTTLDAGSGYSTYVWSPSGNTQTINVTTAGNYSVTVTSANGCSGTTSVNVLVNSNLSPVITGALAFCVGGSTILDAGSGYSTYSWSPSGNTQTITVTSAGTYTVTVTNSSGCSGTVSADVSVSIINSTIIGSDVSCLGGNDGSATINPTGGTPNYSYNWSPSGSNTSTITGLIAGSYSVTIYDANSCTNVNSVTITEPATSISSSILSTTNPTCFGGNDGSITSSTSGGTPPYVYIWSNGDTIQNIDSINAGIYYLTIYDANNCQLIIDTIITNPNPIVITGQSGIGSNNLGYINISVADGSSPYIYTWSNGASTEDIADLNSGTYIITISDANTCLATDTFNIDVPILPLEIPTAISPNKDGKNDNFEIKHIEQYSTVFLEIYNRWGDKLFIFSGSGTEYLNPSNRWDGKFKGKDLPMGGYIYILKISGLEPINGVVSIIR